MPSPVVISDVYSRLLLPHAPGYALWTPSPFDSDPIHVREHGVEIGDVGIITSEGEFMFLFNVCVSRDHDRNRGTELPASFREIAPGHIDFRENHFGPGSDVKTNSYTSRTVGAGANVAIP